MEQSHQEATKNRAAHKSLGSTTLRNWLDIVLVPEIEKLAGQNVADGKLGVACFAGEKPKKKKKRNAFVVSLPESWGVELRNHRELMYSYNLALLLITLTTD